MDQHSAFILNWKITEHNQYGWVLSSVWHTLTYHALPGYLRCVSMLPAILPPPSTVTRYDGGGNMAE